MLILLVSFIPKLKPDYLKHFPMSDPNFPPGPYAQGKHVIPPLRPVDPATAEYRLNHLMLRIKDPEKSLRFYNDCFGLHVIFIFNVGPWTIYYLGPRDVGKLFTLPPLICYY